MEKQDVNQEKIAEDLREALLQLPLTPESYEQWLQERCRIMLTDCIKEFFDEELNHACPNKIIEGFVERFMKRHNLK